VEASFYLQIGTFEEFLRIPRVDRAAIRRELIRFTKSMRGTTVTGHPRTDRRM
jgi:hypothetical protein